MTMISYYMIYYEKLKNAMQGTEKKGVNTYDSCNCVILYLIKNINLKTVVKGKRICPCIYMIIIKIKIKIKIVYL